MTILSSGALAIQDAGTNPSSNVLLDTGYNSLSLAADTSFHMDRAHRYFDGEINQYEYGSDRVVSGTAYVYKRGSTSAYKDTGMSTPFGSNASGFNSAIGENLHTYMNSSFNNFQSWYGTDLGMDASNSSSLGSLGSGTFSSSNGGSRQINDVGIVQNTNNDSGAGAAQDKGNLFWISLDGVVSNTDADAFHQIVIYNNSGQGITLTRSAADYSLTASSGGSSVWTWDSITDAVITYGNHHQGTGTRLYITAASNITFNNGIAEEIGGADSSNVHLSHYYKGSNGAFDHAIDGIPTSGTLKVSDFYGKSMTASMIHSTTWTAGYSSNYVSFSGYTDAFVITGDGMTTPNIPSFDGSSNVKISTLYNVNGGSLYFVLKPISGSHTFSTTSQGWTNLKVWRGQSNNSGTPTWDINRADMTYTVSSNGGTSASASWYVTGSYPLGTYFGSSSAGTACFLELT